MFITSRFESELFRRYVILAAALALLLAVSPVSAAPALKVGSTASYTLTGQLQASQSCTSDPVTYAGPACLGTAVSNPTVSVIISDDGHCGIGTVGNDPFSVLRCRFTPDNVTLPVGGSVVWFNSGNLTHAAATNATANNGLLPFDSGPISPKGTFSHVFDQIGTYYYYDTYYAPLLTHGLLRGTVNVTPALPPPPTPITTALQASVGGTIGWSVEGLSSTEVNLLVSHSLSLSVFVFTPVTESGTLVQSIDLSTRVESAGTATDLVEHVLTGLSAASSGSSLSGAGNVWLQMLASTSSDPSYTSWWVNGPLSSGAALQVDDGWSSVTGSETLNLGNQGTVSAWLVTSQFSQTFNANIPNPSNPLASGSTASASSNINFLWSYDKGSDLLLRSLANTTLTMHSVSNQQVYASNPCAPNGYCPTYTNVKVTRDMRLVLTLSLHLSNTSLRLDQRMPRGNQPQDLSSLVSSMMSTPWTAFGVVGGTAAAIIGLSLWLGRRARKSAIPEATLVPTEGASPSIPPPA